MTVANQCPNCGTDEPMHDQEVYEQQTHGISYITEDIFCECGEQVGSFSYPQP